MCKCTENTNPTGVTAAADRDQLPLQLPAMQDSAMEGPMHLPIQRKLSVGAPDDPLEKEADNMADQVMRMPETSFIQRKCAHCEEEEKAQRKPLASFIQKKEAESGHTAGETASSGIQATRGGGAPLPEVTRSFMENRFGADFSDVRIHNGSYAADLSGELQAQAFTVGRDIYFNTGKFSPESYSGKHLLAHELTHVVQQTQGTGASVMRRWDPPGNECTAAPTGKWLRTVVVEQEIPQSVTLQWSDGTIESGICSAGKGQCCTNTPDGVACSVADSRRSGTNCTPITTGAGYTISDRHLNYNGWRFWNTFVGSRGIALHQHHTVTGEPLSHGCVRLHEEMARKIFCGARQNVTRVQVRGFARPRCDSSQLQAEWLDDIRYATTPTDGESSSVVRGIRATRATLRSAFGVDSDAALNSRLAGIGPLNIASQIPRCTSAAALLNFEEHPLVADFSNTTHSAAIPAAGTVPMQLLTAHNYYHFIPDFEAALYPAAGIIAAQSIIRQHGRNLWRHASSGRTNPDYDERLLYWTRVALVRTIHQWEPSFGLSATQRQTLVDTMEQSSRGMDTATFTDGRNVKRILISGFDPFMLRYTNGLTIPDTSFDVAHRNPSGAVALYMDGRLITDADNRQGRVQTVIFPVRFTDFNAGMVETFFQPYLTGTNPVHLVMTISQGGDDFEVEETAGRLRAEAVTGNEGILGGGQTTPVEPPGIPSTAPLGLPTRLPAPEIRDTLGRSGPIPGETIVGRSGGTGGGYLSNEIFYRTLTLRNSEGSSIPMGHLHIPRPDAMPVAQTITTVENIIRDLLAVI